MFNDVFTQFPLVNLVIFGEMIFFVTFFGSLFWVFRKGSKTFYEKIAAMPLEEET